MGLFSTSDPVTHFPEVSGRRLSSGDEVHIPADLPADATLLVISFRDDMDPLSDQWARLGDRLIGTHGDRVGVWELPVVNKKLKVFGKLATMGIRGQVDGDAERDRTVPLYVDTKAFRKELQLKRQADVYAFLVARDGRIAWRGDGDIDMDEVEALEVAVEEVLAAPPPRPDDETEGHIAAEDDRAEGGAEDHGEASGEDAIVEETEPVGFSAEGLSAPNDAEGRSGRAPVAESTAPPSNTASPGERTEKTNADAEVPHRDPLSDDPARI